ncbi:MAG: SGNH/GDSL hydrolase family protein [Limosilactobacillus sp.]|jgi:lysophospholipase L1-like esterase|uniref:SGNH/GDSL hydrolase family protein n=1 Tax=Limosilactobacillus sp. TaxID=2773925 RepID=UPI0025BE1524|nr:SGNH/GDSL hydrolase family protein [Limosilactobacillus sp.]MCI1975041.1 SGNH/GDSL hydrolase family protein [Limosilactobacillus sp.]MCI2030990.1 SGNH/GDSL hydrolase family protein [Limosilactobacillus sp.]
MRKNKNLFWLALVTVLIVVGGWYSYHHFLGPEIRQEQRVKRVEKRHVKLVALGDSLTYGQGDEKKDGGYVGIIKQKIQNKYKKTTVSTANYGVSGDRSDQILARLNKQKEIQKDLKNADVIVMTVGGNDLMQTLEKDIMMQSQSKIQSNIDQAQETYENKLNQLFTAVRKENKDAPIFVMSIYNPVYTYFPDVEAINDSINQWNRATDNVTKKYSKMHFVSIYKVMSYGQYQTKEQRQQLIQQEEKINHGKVKQSQLLAIMGNKNHNLNEYISTEDNFHPNHLGYQHMSNQLFKSMVKYDSWEYVRE